MLICPKVIVRKDIFSMQFSAQLRHIWPKITDAQDEINQLLVVYGWL